MPAISVNLVADKVTPGTVRFTEPEATVGERPLSIYLPNEVVEAVVGDAMIGTPITLTLGRAVEADSDLVEAVESGTLDADLT